MPFTPAHPAAVLPLRNVLPWSALVVGSLTPDFKYFMLGFSRANSHSLPGLFLFCLPVGLVAWLLFQLVMKRPLALLAPRGDAARLWALASKPSRLSPKLFFLTLIAILVGALSHLIWDAFTHSSGWGVKQIPALSRSIVALHGYDVTVFKLLQHGSTVVGLLFLARAYLRWGLNTRPADATPQLPRRWKRLTLTFIIFAPALAALIYSGASAAAVSNLASLQPFVWRFVTSLIAFGLLALVLYSLACTFAMTRSATTPR